MIYKLVLDFQHP